MNKEELIAEIKKLDEQNLLLFNNVLESIRSSNELTEEDLKNRKEIVSVLSYDPFQFDSVNKKKKLYRDLCMMLDSRFIGDLVLQRAALEICRSYDRIEEWDKEITRITYDPALMRTEHGKLHELTKMKKDEIMSLNNLAKENGLTSKSGGNKATTSLGAFMRDADMFNYDNAVVNLYDLKTSESLRQVADISNESMMAQLGLVESDYIDIIKQMRDKVADLEDKLLRATEEKRLLHTKIAKQELLKELATELRLKGLDDSEVFLGVLSEINYSDDIILQTKQKQVMKELIQNVKKDQNYSADEIDKQIADTLSKKNKKRKIDKQLEEQEKKQAVVDEIPDFSFKNKKGK